MPKEPTVKRLFVFVDGQALYRAAKDAFGYHYPNYDVQKLVEAIAKQQNWKLVKVCFYTGIPDAHENRLWHEFWAAKLAVMGTRGINIFTRPIRHGHEKGIDVRIAIDVVRFAIDDAYDVGLIFSQDQDLSEATDEVKIISKKQDKWRRMASAYPVSPKYLNDRGINKTDWIRIEKSLYDQCIDPNDYRPKVA